ncbi:LysR family transcriptional regulator [Candidimonas humi]|uniref:LysR substrate-binding domain-containing protein n=1 Tax=Candidimonas humi TaxID=683355 RepID=A0ABV8NWV2_9BURK|nr:LysR substrate-binding domain-containing protein [Candidimonas humi]MBV6304065.1 LysR family transcriptional regulator [Candidimonas humi]
MDNRQLRYFVTVAELASMTHAAQALHVSQPALSTHMRHLEEELGVPLLVRGPRGVTPTPHGELLLEHARSILYQFQQAKQEVMSLGKEPRGEVTLGIPATVSPVLIVPLLTAVQERYPHIVPRVIEAMTGFLLEWLHAGRLDIAMLFDVQSAAGLKRSVIGTEELFLVGHPHAFAEGAELSFGELCQYPLILPGRMHGLNMLVRGAAARAGVPLNIQIEVDAVPEMIGLVEQGMGYSLLARLGFHRELEAGKVSIARIAGRPLSRTLVSATAAIRPVSPATRIVLDLSSEIMSNFINAAPEAAPGSSA